MLKKLSLKYDPLISKIKEVFNKPKEIKETDYFYESNLSSFASKTHSIKLINEMNLDELDFIIDII